MKFATLSHLLIKKNLEQLPKSWLQDDLIISPELNVYGAKGRIISLKLTAKEVMSMDRNSVREKILSALKYGYKNMGIELFQLGALTTSVTKGGTWVTENTDFPGHITHGDSYTAAVTSQVANKSLKIFNKKPSETSLAIVGAYGIIGEALAKMLVPKFKHSYLIGRRKEKLEELSKKINGKFETSIELETNKADLIITSTNHPTALLQPEHIKKNAIVVDVSQPPNVSEEICKKRPDIFRVDGGFVDFPEENYIPLPGIPPGKQFACIAEVIMQALENERNNHVGSIDINYLRKTEKLGEKYNFVLKNLTNFGRDIF